MTGPSTLKARSGRSRWQPYITPGYSSALAQRCSNTGAKSGSGEPAPEWHHRFGPEDDKRIYVPDLVFVRTTKHTQVPDYADRASDVMIEIVSPSQSSSRLTAKVEFYLQNGAQSVWVVDPEERRDR